MHTHLAFRPLGLALLAVLANLVISSTSQAQFVCGVAGTGSADSAMSAAVGDIACGTNTTAIGNNAGAPAVSFPNGVLTVELGEFNREEAYFVTGEYTVPLGYSFGLKGEVSGGRAEGDDVIGGSFRLFTRDPSIYLLGVYGAYEVFGEIDIPRIAGEFELYLNRFTLSGRAGLENVEGTILNDAGFFSRVKLAYYPVDDVKLEASYRYLSGANIGSASAEYLFEENDTPLALFVEGAFHDDFDIILGGLKVYFGHPPGTSLIDRHRR